METPRNESNRSQAIDIPSRDEVTAFAGQFFKVIGSVFLEVERQLKAALPIVEAVIRGLVEELPPAYRFALIEMAKHGWYIDTRMGLTVPLEIAKRLRPEESRQEAESQLCSHFTANLDEIEAQICKLFPNRAHIIGPAFDAHRAGQYVLSIPVFLAQADGMCYEKIRAYHFIRGRRSNGNQPATAAHAGDEEHDFVKSILLSPLGSVAPLNMKESERGPDFFGLNRHTVMHGDALDYGTQINGLKAISFINYVSQVLTRESLKLVKG